MDILVLETVASKLKEIAGNDRVTSHEAQWLVRASLLLEEMRQVLLGSKDG